MFEGPLGHKGLSPLIPLLKNESSFRDWLSANLNRIEEGLRLVGTEIGLSHPGLSRGSIDILARDRYGLFVIIEIKKSNATAREAVHELVKYTRLLRETHGLGDEDVRCMLLSTDWRELDGVITDFQAMTNFHVGCYEIHVAPDGNSLEISRHTPIAIGNRLEVFFLRVVCLTTSEEKRLILLERLRGAVDKVGITSAAILSLRYKGDNPNVYIGYGLYLAVAEVSAETHTRLKGNICADLEITPEEIEITTYEDHVYAEVTKHCFGLIDEIGFSTGDELPHLLDSWEVDAVHRIGRLGSNRRVNSDTELIEMLYQKSAVVQTQFSAITSPKLKSSWRDVSDKVLQCVQGIKVWEVAVSALLNTIEQDAPEADVAIRVYCPCDFMMSMFQLVRHDDAHYMPSIEIVYKSNEITHVLNGIIVWDGVTYPENPEGIIRDLGGSDWWAYYLMRNVPEYEEQIVSKHGLSYAATEWSLGNSAQGHWLEISDDALRRIPIDDVRYKPFQEFLNQNREYLQHLVECFETTAYFA